MYSQQAPPACHSVAACTTFSKSNGSPEGGHREVRELPSCQGPTSRHRGDGCHIAPSSSSLHVGGLVQVHRELQSVGCVILHPERGVHGEHLYKKYSKACFHSDFGQSGSPDEFMQECYVVAGTQSL